MSEKLELCRLCANFADYTNAENLYVRKQRKLLAQIEELTGIKLKYSLELPQLICETCREQAVQAHQFRELCIRVQQHFATVQEENESRHIEDATQECGDSSSSCPMDEQEDSFILPIGNELNDKGQQVVAKHGNKNEEEVEYEELQEESTEAFNHDENDGDYGKMEANCTEENSTDFVSKNSKRMLNSHDALKSTPANTHPDVFSYVEVIPPKKSEVRLFVCDLCSGAFKSAVILRDHMVTHTGARNFACEMCNVSFKLRKILVQHYRSKLHKANEKKRQRNKI